jgi:hypothetical protein
MLRNSNLVPAVLYSSFINTGRNFKVVSPRELNCLITAQHELWRHQNSAATALASPLGELLEQVRITSVFEWNSRLKIRLSSHVTHF